ncbi:hypothetical protein Nepgr_008805 [Nepenthes gracilis]|uniref:Uncharacterized protein n=1 Tax=Nepenthes gracilis TaxID=150966 RepID=A0AAD3S9C3_NEPGR|nr:hypothetical protein Nepgr_008805 [Nepenthes gracilis]
MLTKDQKSDDLPRRAPLYPAEPNHRAEAVEFSFVVSHAFTGLFYNQGGGVGFNPCDVGSGASTEVLLQYNRPKETVGLVKEAQSASSFGPLR